MFNILEVVSKGLSAARLRLNVLASNMANAETTRTAEGGPYKRKDIVQIAKDNPSNFGSALDRVSLAEPQVVAVTEDQSAPRKVHQPGHPDADKDGYVSYPNINVVTTMTDLMAVSRLYAANVTVAESTRTMLAEASRLSQRA